MYYVSNPENYCFQGDVLQNIPILQAPDVIKIARVEELEGCASAEKYGVFNEEDVDDIYQNGPEIVLANGVRTKVILLSQTCDIQNRDFVVVAPVFDLKKVQNENRKKAIRDGKINYRFYLPASDGSFCESYVDFSLLSSVKASLINVSNRILSLSDTYRPHLVWGLNRYFCRPFLNVETSEGSSQ